MIPLFSAIIYSNTVKKNTLDMKSLNSLVLFIEAMKVCSELWYSPQLAVQ